MPPANLMKSEWNSFEGGAKDQNKQGTSRKNADGWVHRSLQYLLRYFEKLQASATQRAAALRVTLSLTAVTTVTIAATTGT